jgi:hypothetical protein
MKKTNIIILVLIFLILSLLALKLTSKNSSEKINKISINTEENKESKNESVGFFDKNNCAQYKAIYAALPKIDSYKNIGFAELDCMSTQEKSAFSTSLSVKYGDNKSRNAFNATIFEVSGESAKEELNMVNVSKAGVKLAEQLSSTSGEKLFVLTSIKTLDYGYLTMDHAPNELESSHYTYTGVYKDKYVIVLGIESEKKMEVEQFENYIQEYLQAIKLSELN